MVKGLVRCSELDIYPTCSCCSEKEDEEEDEEDGFEILVRFGSGERLDKVVLSLSLGMDAS